MLFTDPGFGYEPDSSYPDLSEFLIAEPTQLPASGPGLPAGRRKAWRADATDLARCDFTPGRAQMILRGSFRSISLWRRSTKGMTLAQIKEAPDMVPYFIDNMAGFITTVIGESLSPEHFCIVAPPKRRHKIRNFASTVAQGIAAELGIPFHDDFAQCRNRQRVGAIFTAQFTPPQHNVIVFDDFVTSGSTLTSMKQLLDSLGKNSIFFTAILNKK